MSATQFKNTLKPQPDGACCPVRRFLVRINDCGNVKTFGTGLQTSSRVGVTKNLLGESSMKTQIPRSNRKIFVLVSAMVASLLAVPSIAAEVALWNKLDSDAEITNSQIGPVGEKTAGKFVAGPFPGFGQAYLNDDNNLQLYRTPIFTPITMANRVVYSGFPIPTSVNTADLNNDGSLDMVVTTHFDNNNMFILFGSTNGAFQLPAITYSTGGAVPAATTIADFNGDSLLDIVIANHSSARVSVMLGIGNGAFQRQQKTYPIGSGAANFANADFNNDGYLDIAVTNRYSSDVSVLLGTGNGSFKPQVRYALGTDPFGIISGDFNNDGSKDIAAANMGANYFSILFGRGNGSFQPQSTYTVDGGSTGIASGDFNGDGKLDIAVTGAANMPGIYDAIPSSKVSIFSNQGNGDFQIEGTFDVGGAPFGIRSADFNNDGQVDLAVTNTILNNVVFLIGTGHGSFELQEISYPVGDGPIGFTSADLNNDGRVDIAAANFNSYNGDTISVLLNTTPVITRPQLVSLGDINQDNSPEIAVVTYNPTLKKSTAAVKNVQTGALVKQIAFNGQFVPTKANVLPDLNGNGAPELAVLGVRSSDQAVQVEVRDSLSGVKLSAVPFDSTFTALDLGVVRDISGKGTAGLAVLQQSDTELRVELKNALSGVQIGNISFSAGYKGIDLIVLGDLNGNRAKEIAVLADNKTVTAADTVEIRDSKTGVLIRTISYGTGKDLQQLINLPDLNNSGGAELAVLRANTARVLVKDAKTGLPVNTLDYAVSQPFRLATAADSNSQTNLAMLGVRAATGQPRADVHAPLSDTFINKVIYDNYGTTVGFISIPDINGNGVAELVRLREQPGPQKLFAEVRDGRTGVLIQGMYF